jgi:hypothetical protein
MKKCPTGKVSYSSLSLAEDALIDSWSRNNFTPTNGPINVYVCDDCGTYHFTSKGTINTRLKTELDSGLINKQRLAFDLEIKLRRR